MDYQRAHQEALQLYNAKVKDFPELAGVRKKKMEEKRVPRRTTMKGDSLNFTDGVLKETITDDRGREIVFKKPDGNRLSRVCPAFKDGMAVSFQPTKIKLKKKVKQAEPPTGPEVAEAAQKGEGFTPEKLPGQSDAFERHPIFKAHFHEIVPGDSEDEDKPEKLGIAARLSQKFLVND